MQSSVANAAPTRESAEPQAFQKRIDSTVYRVTVHFSQTSTESLEDKLIRLMEREVQESA